MKKSKLTCPHCEKELPEDFVRAKKHKPKLIILGLCTLMATFAILFVMFFPMYERYVHKSWPPDYFECTSLTGRYVCRKDLDGYMHFGRVSIKADIKIKLFSGPPSQQDRFRITPLWW